MRRTPLRRMTKAGRNEAYVRELFARACLHFVGNDDSYGKPFELEKFERERIWNPIFGTGHMEHGTFVRKYRRALIGLPRGVGKTVLAASMLLSEAMMNPMQNGQYGLIADSKDSVQNDFQVIVAMVRLSPELRKGWRVYKNEIRNVETGAWIRVFPNDEGALQGWHFNMAICDEVHVYRDDRIWKAVTSGQARIPNALAVAITTAAGARKGFLWDWLQEVDEDDACYLYWLGLDDEDDANDERCWRKLMVTPRITADQLRDQRKALGRRSFERYQLNRFPLERQEEPFMHEQDVNACRKDSATIDRSSFFVVGVDGAVSGDTLAVVAYQDTGESDAFEEWTWDAPSNLGVYDLTDVADVLCELAGSSGHPLVCSDPARLSFLANWLYRERDLEMFDVKQTPQVMCPASEMLARSVRTHRAALSATPVLAEHCVNAIADESRAYGRRLSSRRHGKGSERIDASIAAAMAMWAYDQNVASAVDWSGGVFSIAL